MASFVVKNMHYNDTSYNEIEWCAKNIHTIQLGGFMWPSREKENVAFEFLYYILHLNFIFVIWNEKLQIFNR